jgi:hypothetical protein
LSYSAHSAAVRICERAYDAWFSRQGSGDTCTPMAALAAFMFADKIDAAKLLAGTDRQIVYDVTAMWSWFYLQRPDLYNLCGPLASWMNAEQVDDGTARAVAATVRAAAKAGLGQLVSDGHLADVDLLGHAYTTMRPKAARGARGEFYSPEQLCYLMAQMILGDCKDLPPGASIAEPAAGTGGMVRAAAQVIREAGRDPAEFVWVVNDISPQVVAGLAVNCHVWGLGPNVIIGVADTLAEPDWQARAWQAQTGAIEHARELWKDATMLALLRQADRMVSAAADPAPPALPAAPPPVADVELPGDGTLFDLPEPLDARPRRKEFLRKALVLRPDLSDLGKMSDEAATLFDDDQITDPTE